MTGKNFNYVAAFFLLGMSANLFGDDEKEDVQISIQDSDSELKKINLKLSKISQAVESLPRAATAPGLGAQTLEAQRAFERAESAFLAKEWAVAINEAKSFITLTQKPDPKTWLRAQFILGRAYEENNQFSRATTAYSRYLATFSTKPQEDSTDLTTVFERLVRIATKHTMSSRAELSRFLSTIAAMEHPSNVSEELKYLTAIAGSNVGLKDFAIRSLGEVGVNANSQDTKARAKYFRALIAINGKDWQTAADQLQAVLDFDGLSAAARDNARLSLARVLIKLKKPRLALATYNQIPKESESTRDAAFEKVFLLVKLNKNNEARDLAKAWLADNPAHSDATQLRMIASWLELRAGELDSAKSHIDKTTEALSAIQKSLKGDFQKAKFTQEDAIRLAELTKGQVSPSPEHEEIIAMFQQIAEMNERLREIDGLERSIIYALAKSDLKQFRPALENRLAQYDTLADEILNTGRILVKIEQERLENRLSAIDKQKLSANELRRQQLFGRHEGLKRQAKRWAGWAVSANQLVQLATSWERLNRLNAENSASAFRGEATSDINDLKASIATAREDMVRTLIEIRKQQVEGIINHSAISDSLTIVEDYAQLIDEDLQNLSLYEPQQGNALDQLDDDDSRTARKTWQATITGLYSNIKNLKAETSAELVKLLNSLETIDSQKTALLRDIGYLTDILQTFGGESLPGIINHYDYALGQRVGRQLKWAGDLEYLRYVDTTSAQDAEARKRALENQILSDDVRDYGQRRAK